MNARKELQLARLVRLDVYLENHPPLPAIPRVTLLAAEVKSLIAEANREGSDQRQGLGDYRAGSSTRAAQALALNKRLREIGRTARALPRAEYPGAAEQFRVPQSLRYQQLIDFGHAFLAAIGPIKSAFVERAFPADFDEQLAQQIADFDAATQRQMRGRQKQREGTAGLEVTMQRAKLVVAELDAIMSVLLRTSNPTQYAVWKSAVRVHKSPHGTPDERNQTSVQNVESRPDSGGADNSGPVDTILALNSGIPAPDSPTESLPSLRGKLDTGGASG